MASLCNGGFKWASYATSRKQVLFRWRSSSSSHIGRNALLRSEKVDETLQSDSSSSSEQQGQNQNGPSSSGNGKQPIQLFPWRHETDPLPRIVPGTMEYHTEGPLHGRFMNKRPGNATLSIWATAYMFLDIPLYDVLVFGSWKEELCENVSWAFTQGVAALLSNLCHVPMNEIVKDTYEINFRKNIVGNDEDPKVANKMSDELPLDAMMEKKLISFYKSAFFHNNHDNNSNIGGQQQPQKREMCLQTVPYGAELVSLICIPYISRSNVKNDPWLVDFYTKSVDGKNTDLNELRQKYMETGRMESTLIAQVLVHCNEVFYVKEQPRGNSGDVVVDDDDSSEQELCLQGQSDAESRNIPHLVRVEMTVKTQRDDNGKLQNIPDNWIITDIDDLLGGNVIV